MYSIPYLQNKSDSFQKKCCTICFSGMLGTTQAYPRWDLFSGYLSCLMFGFWEAVGPRPPSPMATRHWRHTHSFCGGSFPLPRRAGFIDFALWIYLVPPKIEISTYLEKKLLTKTMRKSLIHQVIPFGVSKLEKFATNRFSVPIFLFKNPDVPRFYVQDPFLLHRVCISSEYPTDHPIANRCQ